MQTGILDDGSLSVTNARSGTISSNNGINAAGTANVTNSGAISATGAGSVGIDKRRDIKLICFQVNS